MTYRTMLDLIQETVSETGTEEIREYSIISVTKLIDKFKNSDVTLLLSWAGGMILTESLDKISKGIADGLSDEEIEESLSEKEQAMVYGAYLLSESED